MGSLLRGVLHFRLVVLGVAAGLLGLGIVVIRGAPVDVLPEFTPPYAEIQTEALGLSADEVEQLITVPLEADLLNGVEGVEVIRSQSLPGLSSIVLVFAPGTDIYRGRQLVEERLTQAHAGLPNVSKPPTLLPPLSSSNRVLMIGLASDKVSPIEQSVIARWTVKPRLMGVPGVANVSVWGLRDQQLQVQVDPERLRDAGVTLSQVIRSAGNAQVVSPLSFLEASTPGTGGFIETPQQRLQVRHLLEKIADPAELGKVPVSDTDGHLRLADVATITINHQPLIGDAVVSGGRGLMLVVEKFPGASTLEVTKGVENALEALKPGLSGIQTDTSLFRPATYIDEAMDNLAVAFCVGFLLMLLVMAALRFRWRAVLIALITVPLSLVVAGLVLQILGQGFNALVFLGLAAAVTVVVDEAVVFTERVMWRLQRCAHNGDAPSIATVVSEASRDVRAPLVYATLTVLLAVAPIAVVGGRPGAFFAPMVLAYVLAVAAATIVALTVTPALSVLLFRRWQPAARRRPQAERVTRAYASALQRFGEKPWIPWGVTGAVLVVAAAALPLFGTSLIPQFREQSVLVQLDAELGTSNPRMTEIATELGDKLAALPGVQSVAASVGRAVTGDRVADVSSSDIWVAIANEADYDATMRAIKETVEQVPGVRHDVMTYTAQKIRNVGALNSGENPVADNGRLDVLTGSDRPLVVRVFGQDVDILQRQAERVKDVLAAVPGVVDPRVDLPERQPTIEIEVDLNRAQTLGVSPGIVRRAAATLLQGIQVGSLFEDQKVFDVIVQGTPSTRESVDDVRNLLIDLPGGGHARLGEVADVRITETPAVIERDAVSRRIDVDAGVSGRSVDSVVADIKTRLAAVGFPLEYHAEVREVSTRREIGAARVIGFAVTAAVGAFLLLQAAFGSWRLAALAFTMLPLALVGGLAAGAIQGHVLSAGSLIGFLAVFALAARTSILFVTGAQALGREHPEMPTPAIVRLAAQERLRPVLMTTAALVFVLAPVVVLGSRRGLELIQPMSVVILGGLASCILVTFLLLPALYHQLGPSRPTRNSQSREEVQLVGPDRARVGAADRGPNR
jgi:Cu/Ag efflux pump CusA